jgi:MtrB/PioB family decaheme-associated outer membrane protein
MRNRSLLVVAFALLPALRANAQDPPTLPQPTDPVAVGRSELTGRPYGTVDFGGRLTHVDGDEARYQRYRDLRSGLYGTNFIYGQRRENWNVEGQAWNIGYRDQKYQVDLTRVGRLSATFLWDQIPLFISRDTRTLYVDTAPGIFRLEDPMQQEIQAANRTLHDYEDQAARFDLRTMRQIGQADIAFRATPQTDLIFQVRGTNRNGAIPFGGTFGFSNAVELPAPIDTRTTDVRTALEWGDGKSMLRVGWDGSAFSDQLELAVWDNPLRYGPDISGTPSQGRMSLWPSNTLNYLHGTGATSFPLHGRVTGYVAFGQGRSNEPLLPYTINTAVPFMPLARETAEGEQHTTVAQFTASMRPTRIIGLNAKYRYADVDVRTSVFERPNGNVPYDSKQSTPPASPSAYHSVKRNTFDVDGVVVVAPHTSVKVGFSALGTDYTHRIWESTSENVFRVSADTAGWSGLMVRALYENRSREGDNFDADALDEVGELPTMRHYDVADRDRNRFTLIANYSPGGLFGVNASLGVGRDEYPDTTHGLLNYDTNQAAVGFTIAPEGPYSLDASYGWEKYTSLQRSRNASDAAQQADARRDWTTDFTGKVNYFDVSFDIDHAIERSLIRIFSDWNRSNDTYLYGLVTGSPLTPPAQLPPVKNEMFRFNVDLTYDLARNLKFGVAYWFEDYDVEDFALGPDTLSGIALPPVEPGETGSTNALLLGYLYRPYTAHTGFVRLTYLW